MIQDIIISGMLMLVLLALLPTIFSDDKPNIITSIVMAVALAFIAGAFVSLKMWFSAVANWVGSALWFIIIMQTVNKWE